MKTFNYESNCVKYNNCFFDVGEYEKGKLSLAIYGMFESMSRFSIGCADTLCLIFFVTIPLLHSNTYQKSEEDKEQKLEESEIAISPRSRRGKHSNNIK